MSEFCSGWFGIRKTQCCANIASCGSMCQDLVLMDQVSLDPRNPIDVNTSSCNSSSLDLHLAELCACEIQFGINTSLRASKCQSSSTRWNWLLGHVPSLQPRPGIGSHSISQAQGPKHPLCMMAQTLEVPKPPSEEHSCRR